MFYILNVRNKFCKTPGQAGIIKDVLSNLKNKIDKFITYIEGLEINARCKKSNKENDINNVIKNKIKNKTAEISLGL